MGFEWCLEKARLVTEAAQRRIFLRRWGRIQIGKIGGGENGPRVAEPANCRASSSQKCVR